MILQYLTSLRIKINLKNAKDKTRRGVGRRVAFFDCILKIASKRKKDNVTMVTNGYHGHQCWPDDKFWIAHRFQKNNNKYSVPS